MGLRILHANANVLMASGLHSLLKAGGNVDLIQHAKDEATLFSLLEKEVYDLVVIDPLSSDYFTIGTTPKLKEKFPQTRVLVISDIHSAQNVLQILSRGVQGYLTRQCDEAEIKHAVATIAKGEKFYCNKVIDIALNKDFDADNCDPTILTERENQITALIAKGFTNKEIGEKLHLSHHTVHTHRKNILKKLGIKSASELTVYAVSVGLI